MQEKTGLIKRKRHVELTVKADFDKHYRHIEAALEKMSFRIEYSCKLYNQSANSDGYPRIRYSIPGLYRCWDDGKLMKWQYRRKGRMYTRKKLRDFRIYLHSYLYWRAHGNYKTKDKEISHLCGKRNCGNVRHYTLESHTKNLSRIDCTNLKSCSHTPPCIK